MEGVVQDRVDRDADVSTGQVRKELKVSHMNTGRAQPEQLLCPLQVLNLADFAKRDNFCRGFLFHRSAEHFFVSSVQFADEVRFVETSSSITIHNQVQYGQGQSSYCNTFYIPAAVQH
jgi:hypothetical protein